MVYQIVFLQKDNERIISETIMCIRNGYRYEVSEVPLVITQIAVGDLFEAEYVEKDKCYYYDTMVSRSGNSTLRVYCSSRKDMIEAKTRLEGIGCLCRPCLVDYIVGVCVPRNVNYYTVLLFLDTGQEAGKWKFDVIYKGYVMPQSLVPKTEEQVEKHIEIVCLRMGENLHKARATKKEALMTVSARTGIDYKVMYELENGVVGNFELISFLRLCAYYDRDPADAFK